MQLFSVLGRKEPQSNRHEIIDGDFSAESLDLGGVVTGNVTTTGAVVVRGGARLRGEVKSAQVAFEPGARVSVRLNTPFEIEF